MANVKKVKLYTTDHNFFKLIGSLPGCSPASVYPWLNRKISELCRDKILPILPIIDAETQKHQICIIIQELEFAEPDLTNLSLLEKFAEFEKSSVANIINKYIIFPHLEQEYLFGKLVK